ncbi:IS200/IS605 family transposase [Candidatus Bathyarchaeota archaeon]|jgi:putative transposase|nr:IS200/IS605 family transposase [Candidatus Bathyarchaeota archaeon]
MDYKQSEHQVYLLNYHLIWCPKRRRKILVDSVKRRLEEIIRQVAKELGVDILALEVMPDHLHLFISAYPQLSIPHIVKSFKGRSSHDLRKEFPELNKMPSLWTHSYFVSTAGNVSAESIQKYIEAQSKK